MIQYYAIPGLKYREITSFGMMPEHIITTACAVTGLDRAELATKGGTHLSRHYRCIIMRMLREKTQLTLKEIGQYFGTDHSGVLHGLRIIYYAAKNKPHIQQIINEIETQLKS